MVSVLAAPTRQPIRQLVGVTSDDRCNLAAVPRRLHGESLLSVQVTPATLRRPGRVVLSTPSGYEYLTEAAWSTVATRMPPGYELVVTRPNPVAPDRTDRELPRAA